MNLTIGQNTHGFIVDDIRRLDEVKATMYHLTHAKTKAEMIYLDRPDPNMTFSVTMKTIPSDDSGVFHILEHSVLGGSQKYPVKEPFVELLKSSMNTFLNAMTGADKTIYPVSSQTPKDFLNLVEVYLDAVFAPSIYTKKDIFLQEGWHYEILKPEDEPTFKGVVFNEMKGAYSSVDSYIDYGMNKLLFADNCYQYESGGFPASIPDLTYEEFLNQHHKFYSFSNSRIFLDGNVPFEEVMCLIDEYIKDAEYIEVDNTINDQQEKTGLFSSSYYPIDENEDEANHTMISFGKIVSNYSEIEKNYAYKILCNYLAGSNDSPIKKAILEKELAQDLSLDLVDGCKQPWISCTARYTETSKLDEIKNTILEVLENEVKNGLDHSIIEAILSFLEFQAKERGNAPYPQGLLLNFTMLDTWLFGGDPAAPILINDVFKSLRKKMDEGYFESLIQDFLDHKEYTATVVVNPSKTLTQEQEKVEAAKCKAAKESWDDETVQKFIAENEHLAAWQQSVDTPEQLATMPQLAISDIPTEIETYPYVKSDLNGIPVLKYQLNSDGITYLHLYFSIADLPQEDLVYLSCYLNVLTELPTEKYDVTTLQTLIKATFGAINAGTASYDKAGNIHECQPYFTIKCSFLDENADKAYDLLEEILYHTQFKDTKKVKNVFAQLETNQYQSLMGSGHRFGMTRILASHSAKGAFNEAFTGYSAYLFIKDFNAHFDERIDNLLAKFTQFTSIYNKNALTISYNGNASIEGINKLVYEGSKHGNTTSYTLLPKKNEEIKLPTQITYASLGGNLFEHYSINDVNLAKAKVFYTIISLEYLWNEVRVRGGAYGAGLQITPSADCGFYSYRDPSGRKSLEIFKATKAFIDQYCQSKDNVDKFIISTLSNEAILSTTGKLAFAERCYFSGISDEQRRKEREMILNTKVSDLLEIADQLQKVIEDDHTCLIGNV